MTAAHLRGKSREEIAELLGTKSRGELLDLLASLVALEPLLSAQEIAVRSGISPRDVRAAINRGEIGGGFFCRGINSKRVTASAANAWLRSFFVPVGGVE